MTLSDKIALVTEAGQGIGKACALTIATQGARAMPAPTFPMLTISLLLLSTDWTLEQVGPFTASMDMKP